MFLIFYLSLSVCGFYTSAGNREKVSPLSFLCILLFLLSFLPSFFIFISSSHPLLLCFLSIPLANPSFCDITLCHCDITSCQGEITSSACSGSSRHDTPLSPPPPLHLPSPCMVVGGRGSKKCTGFHHYC